MESTIRKLTELGNVICEPAKSSTWNKDAEVMPEFGLRGYWIWIRERGRPYLSSIGISEKYSNKASLMGR
jgi:hypothetical protein